MRKRDAILSCVVLALVSTPVGAISDGQKSAIVDHCEAIKISLRDLQKRDSRTRVYLGGYYEAILTKFMKPLNIKLMEEDLSRGDLVDNQSDFAEIKVTFASDFVGYQQKLEELVGMDCKKNPEDFYDKLTKVREKRKVVNQDATKMRKLVGEHIAYVGELLGKVQSEKN